MHQQHGVDQTKAMAEVPAGGWRARLAQRLPFYYGWVVLAIVSSTSYAARPLMSVAVLSVFVLPMTAEFGWSRGFFSGAVSLGGLCAAVIAPLIGRLLDRRGSGVILGLTSAVAGLCALGLAFVQQTWTFYATYIPGRMAFASPLELGASTALSNWFRRRRALALALYGVTQGTGLATMPIVAQFLIATRGWRQAWLTLGVYTLLVGIAPAMLLIVRRPEDLGLTPDPVAAPAGQGSAAHHPLSGRPAAEEQQFTLRQAMTTRAFWVLSVFSAVGFMTQAGISLHQVSHYRHQGFPATVATLMASTFALAQVPAGLFWSSLLKRIPVRGALALTGLAVALGALGTTLATTLAPALLVATILGCGVGGLHMLLRLAWADYYGRQHLGTIQGVTLPVQIGGQAVGPVTAGLVFDITGGYHHAFLFFAALVTLGSLLVLTAVPPQLTASPTDAPA